jgi:hypothetical protein
VQGRVVAWVAARTLREGCRATPMRVGALDTVAEGRRTHTARVEALGPTERAGLIALDRPVAEGTGITPGLAVEVPPGLQALAWAMGAWEERGSGNRSQRVVVCRIHRRLLSCSHEVSEALPLSFSTRSLRRNKFPQTGAINN